MNTIGSSRSTAAIHDAGEPGEPSVGNGHEARAAFVAAGDHVDLVEVAERVQDAQVAFARDEEDPVDAIVARRDDRGAPLTRLSALASRTPKQEALLQDAKKVP